MNSVPAMDAAIKSPEAGCAQGEVVTARVVILTGGADKPYALGLASSLLAAGVAFDFIGSNEVDGPELHCNPQVRFLNLRGDQRMDAGLLRKVFRVLVYYVRLLAYAVTSRAPVFHILWNNKVEYLDRTLVLLFYRLCGKRIVFTAHNVNVRKRDGNDTWLNRWTLHIQYQLLTHVFVHTERMKQELLADFGMAAERVSVIPFGINSTVPNTSLTPAAARERLGLKLTDKVALFFGNIAPYKGLEFLVQATAALAATIPELRLIIAGRPKGEPEYWDGIRQQISAPGLREQITTRIEYVPDADTEIYFKAADVLVLPYTHIFQSGVLFLAYSFGLPTIATDVGSLKEDIIEGKTGLICRPRDPADLARTIDSYFSSDLYQQLASRRPEIQRFANEKHSWTKVGAITEAVYRKLAAGR